MVFLDMDRARALMRDAGLDALLAFSPNNLFHVSGYQSPLLQIFGPGASAMALLPADPDRSPAMIVNAFEDVPARRASHIEDIRSYPLWIEMTTRAELEAGWTNALAKPEQFDAMANFRQLADILQERGLAEGRIGTETSTLSHLAYTQLVRACPDLRLEEAGPLFLELRRIKTPEEIQRLRFAAQIAEQGMLASVADGVTGITQKELNIRYQTEVLEAARSSSGSGLFQSANPYNITIGADCFPAAGQNDDRARPGDIVKFDIGATVGGYSSDHGRTYVIGGADTLQGKIHAALQAGQEAGLEAMRPGATMASVYEAAQEAVRKSGFPAYTRGHVGHHLGLTVGEEPPFIAPEETCTLAPGMVLALEVPLYADGVGAFQIEDNLVITETGCELFTSSARSLTPIS